MDKTIKLIFLAHSLHMRLMNFIFFKISKFKFTNLIRFSPLARLALLQQGGDVLLIDEMPLTLAH